MKACLLLAGLAACSSGNVTPDGGADSGDAGPPKYAPTKLPPLGDVQTTVDRTIVPSHAIAMPPEKRDSREPPSREALLADGFGDFKFGPGEPVTVRTPPTMTVPPAGPNAKMLVRFVHMPDIQLADDESTTRLARFDGPQTPTASAYRPHDVDVCRMVNAAVRTINVLHKKTPFSFLLLGGDNADSAQKNEVDWALDILAGADRVECDSGADDDPIAGADNDAKDPFTAEGLAMPFYWVSGNHDVLIQGNLLPNDFQRILAEGDEPKGGTRFWAEHGGPVTWSGPVPIDPSRVALSRTELLQRVLAHKDGHGITASQAQTGRAFYTFDVPSSPLRFVILDTTSEAGSSEGLIRTGDFTTYAKPLLDKAQSDGKWVVLASHHAVGSMGDGSGLGGTKQADAMTSEQWANALGAYTNIVYSIVGHSHANRIRWIQPTTAIHPWWEVMTSAIADWPHQFRAIEIWDDDNGWLRLRGIDVDFATDGDPVALEGKKLGILDLTSGWITNGGNGSLDDRNVDVLVPKP